jgi:hypothetical protein
VTEKLAESCPFPKTFPGQLRVRHRTKKGELDVVLTSWSSDACAVRSIANGVVWVMKRTMRELPNLMGNYIWERQMWTSWSHLLGSELGEWWSPSFLIRGRESWSLMTLMP